MENNESTEYLNWLRVFAAFAVLMIHIIFTPVTFCQELYTKTELFWIRFFQKYIKLGSSCFCNDYRCSFSQSSKGDYF